MSDTWVDLDGTTRLQGTLLGPGGSVTSVFGRAGVVVAVNGDYAGVVATHLTGATAATRYVGGTTTGSPGSGSFLVGDFVIAQDGVVWVCTVAGSPGTWQQAGGGVLGLTAADTSVVVGGTAQNPTVRTGTVDVIATQHPAAANWSNAGFKITSVGLATLSSDVASLANSLSDFAVPSANVPWNSKKITGLANGAGAQDAAAFGQIPTSLPPSGSAGGSLSGTYPNPGLGTGVITDTNVQAAAGIVYSKLTLTGGIVNADISGAAAIAASKFASYPADGTKFLNGAGGWTVPGGGGTVTSVTATNATIVVAGTAADPTIAAAALNTQAGTTALSGNLAMNTHKLTGLAAGSANGDSVRWEQSAAGVMTASGDTIYASAANTLARLAKGSDGQVLKLASGLPSWAAAASYACLLDQKTQNTSGGTFTSGAWRTRDMNTEQSDTDNIASISANQITLAAGTYVCSISAPASGVENNQARLYNVTDSALILTGANAYSQTPSGPASCVSLVAGQFTIGASKALEVQHQCSTTRATYGYGGACNFGAEVYTVAQFWKVA